ncbi:MAG: LLM class flavin-dependent oxidoreductase [Actinomycetaceae bacterium]
MPLSLSVLDLATIGPGRTARDSLRASVELAQTAERVGYGRVWYAEHHNMPTIASSATSVLIGHVAAHTSTIRLGAGGVMLPNHSPLVIAEQFGTLATLFPGRIDLGLGRAPGSDRVTMQALRRTPASSESFPQDVVELRGYLRDESVVDGVRAIPGAGTDVPLFILGSSLFGAQLAAALGLPYAFASHFAPDLLHQAAAAYREGFTPSDQLEAPYLIAGVNVIAADDAERAQTRFATARRARLRSMLRPEVAADVTDVQLDQVLAGPQGQQVAHQLRYTAVGTGDQVRGSLDEFAASVDADELIVSPLDVDADDRLRSLELTAAATGLVPR